MGKVGDKMTGFCMKEKVKVEFVVVTAEKTKRGTTLNKGKCPNCGTTVCIMSK